MASVDDATLVNMFQSTLVHLPRTSNANDYNTQDSSSDGDLDNFVTDSGGPDDLSPPPIGILQNPRLLHSKR